MCVSARCLVLSILLLYSSVSFTDQVLIEPIVSDPVPIERDSSSYLQYDDGIISWFIWFGTYRGVWFNVEDFMPGATGFEIEYSEFWMYHHSSYPWDTSNFYAEVWNGDSQGPLVQLDVQELIAIHYAPVYALYDPALQAESDFWVMENTEMSAGGWPSNLADGTPPLVPHSHYGNGWFELGDFFFRCCGEALGVALERVTWGEIKAVF